MASKYIWAAFINYDHAVAARAKAAAELFGEFSRHIDLGSKHFFFPIG
jgi:hypothetical protein